MIQKNSRAVALVELGLTTGWLAGRRNAGKFRILKFNVDQTFAAFNKVTALLEQYECINLYNFIPT